MKNVFMTLGLIIFSTVAIAGTDRLILPVIPTPWTCAMTPIGYQDSSIECKREYLDYSETCVGLRTLDSVGDGACTEGWYVKQSISHTLDPRRAKNEISAIDTTPFTADTSVENWKRADGGHTDDLPQPMRTRSDISWQALQHMMQAICNNRSGEGVRYQRTTRLIPRAHVGGTGLRFKQMEVLQDDNLTVTNVNTD
jgi:hypothetical protein